MFGSSGGTTLETEQESADTEYGFTWVHVDGNYLIRSPDDQFKEVPEVVIRTLKEKASELSIDELVAEVAGQDPAAGDVLREMRDGDYIREGAPVERVHPPDDIRLWPRALGVGLLVCVAGLLWFQTLTTMLETFIKEPFRYLVEVAVISVPLVVGSVVVHEYGHYRAASKQGLDPSIGFTVINGVFPAVVTRTNGGWALPRNRRMWNTLGGAALGFPWTIGVFALYYTVLPHPGIAVAGIISFNLEAATLIPIFHGDGYRLMTDLVGDHNVRTRGLSDLRNVRPSWAAAYALFSYGFAITVFAVQLVVGYKLGQFPGAVLILALVALIYAESRVGVVSQLRGNLA